MNGHSLGTLQSPYGPCGSIVLGPVELSLELPLSETRPPELDVPSAPVEAVSDWPVDGVVSCCPDEPEASVESEVSPEPAVVLTTSSDVEVVDDVMVVDWPCVIGSFGL